jgi:hypothetical protein
MKSKKELGSLVLLFVLMLLPSAANALPAGTLPGWSDSVDFEQYGPNGRTLIGRVDWGVYAYNDYPGSAPPGGAYVYAYQILNSGHSTVGVDSFSVGILEGAGVVGIGSDDFEVVDCIEPFHEYFSPDAQTAQSAIYLFLPETNGLVGSGQYSFNLLFSSDIGPTADGFGMVAGGSIGKAIEGLPTPVPEPATIFLLGVGGAAVTLSRKRRFI